MEIDLQTTYQVVQVVLKIKFELYEVFFFCGHF